LKKNIILKNTLYNNKKKKLKIEEGTGGGQYLTLQTINQC
jgi:hypothetical protein